MIATRNGHRRTSSGSVGYRVGSVTMAVGLVIASLATVVGVGATSASASTVCDPANDTCVIYPDTVQTPLGLVSVTVTATNVVTVHLDSTYANALVIGVPFSLPPGVPVSGCPGGCTRTTIATAGGLVTIDTFQMPPGPPNRPVFPSLAIISIHPPNPCRVSTSGTTVTFTPIQMPLGPPT